MLIRGIRLAVEAASCPAGYTSGKIYWAQAHTGLEMLEIPEWVCKRRKKGKGHSRTSHEGPEGERRYSSTLL
jgi:hypothetical protein